MISPHSDPELYQKNTIQGLISSGTKCTKRSNKRVKDKSSSDKTNDNEVNASEDEGNENIIDNDTNNYQKFCNNLYHNSSHAIDLQIAFKYGVSFVANETSPSNFIHRFEKQMVDKVEDFFCIQGDISALSSFPSDQMIDESCPQDFLNAFDGTACRVVHGMMTLSHNDSSTKDIDKNVISFLSNSTGSFQIVTEKGEVIARVLFVGTYDNEAKKSSAVKFFNLDFDEDTFTWGVIIFVGLISVLSAGCCFLKYFKRKNRSVSSNAGENASKKTSYCLPFFRSQSTN